MKFPRNNYLIVNLLTAITLMVHSFKWTKFFFCCYDKGQRLFHFYPILYTFFFLNVNIKLEALVNCSKYVRRNFLIIHELLNNSDKYLLTYILQYGYIFLRFSIIVTKLSRISHLIISL